MIDITGFSAWCSNHIPSIIAKTMIEYNNLIGDLLENYPTLKKIELVGDCCMVVGCYAKDDNANDTNCFTCIKFAIDLLSHIDTIKMMFRSKYVGLRIGIHLSDVIGLYLDNPKKYQMYGNDINVCSRLESSTNPNTIHISEKTLMCVKDIEEQELPENLCVKGNSHKMEHKGVGVITSYIFHLKRVKVLFYNFTIKTANYFSDIFDIDHYTHESDMQVANTLYKSFQYLCVVINLFEFNDQYNIIEDIVDLHDVRKNTPCVYQNVIVLCKSDSMVNDIKKKYPYQFEHVIIHSEHAQIRKLISFYSENKHTFRERGKSFDL
jgi:class 3 adenylate cyclase